MIEPDNEENREQMREFMGPGAVDRMIRQAISTCWMIMPPERRNICGVEEEIRRLVDWALRDMNEDATSIGIGNG
jgi:hypothetical protein